MVCFKQFCKCNIHLTCVFFLLIIFCCLSIAEGARKVTVNYNPGCKEASCRNSSLSIHLLYARAESSDDSLHYIVSTIGPSFPTVLLLNSRHKEATIKIDWTKLLLQPLNDSLLRGAIKIINGSSGKPYNDAPEVAVYLFSQIIGYSDNADSVDLNDPKNGNKTVLKLDDLEWNVKYTNDSALFSVTNDSSSYFGNETLLGLNFTFYNDEGRDSVLPRLSFNDKSAKMKLVVQNFTANFTNPRFAMAVHVANPQNTSALHGPSRENGYIDKTSSRSIDDEYAPSVFTSTNVMWKTVGSKSNDNFWRWRTVCYTQPIPTRKYSTDVKSVNMQVMNQINFTEIVQDNRLLLSYFGRLNLDHFRFNSTTISFGKPEDDFYSATDYVSWTTLIGFGTPPGDSLSFMVIGILLAGVVLPILVIIGGGICMAVRKSKLRRSRKAVIEAQYEPIG